MPIEYKLDLNYKRVDGKNCKTNPTYCTSCNINKYCNCFFQEMYQMISVQRVSLADLLLLFLYLEVLAMVRVFWESQSIQITLPLFIAITALARFIILQGKSLNPEILLYEAGAIVLIALAIVILRFRNSPLIGLNKKKK